MIAHIEQLVEFFAEGKGIAQAVLTGGTLAGDHRPHFGAGATHIQAGAVEELDQRFHIPVGYALDLHCQTGGHGNLAGAELLGGLSHGSVFRAGKFAVAGDDAHVEAVGCTFIPQTAQPLEPLDLVGGRLEPES